MKVALTKVEGQNISDITLNSLPLDVGLVLRARMDEVVGEKLRLANEFLAGSQRAERIDFRTLPYKKLLTASVNAALTLGSDPLAWRKLPISTVIAYMGEANRIQRERNSAAKQQQDAYNKAANRRPRVVKSPDTRIEEKEVAMPAKGAAKTETLAYDILRGKNTLGPQNLIS